MSAPSSPVLVKRTYRSGQFLESSVAQTATDQAYDASTVRRVLGVLGTRAGGDATEHTDSWSVPLGSIPAYMNSTTNGVKRAAFELWHGFRIHLDARTGVPHLVVTKRKSVWPSFVDYAIVLVCLTSICLFACIRYRETLYNNDTSTSTILDGGKNDGSVYAEYGGPVFVPAAAAPSSSYM